MFEMDFCFHVLSCKSDLFLYVMTTVFLPDMLLSLSAFLCFFSSLYYLLHRRQLRRPWRRCCITGTRTRTACSLTTCPTLPPRSATPRCCSLPTRWSHSLDRTRACATQTCCVTPVCQLMCTEMSTSSWPSRSQGVLWIECDIWFRWLYICM